MQRAFETIGFGKVSTSAADARRLGYLRDADGVTMNRERLIADAKARRAGAGGGYVQAGAAHRDPRRRRESGGAEAGRPPGLAGRADQRPRRADRAHAGAGSRRRPSPARGDASPKQHLLDLEREAFLSLCGEPKTLERIAAHAEDRQAAEELTGRQADFHECPATAAPAR